MVRLTIISQEEIKRAQEVFLIKSKPLFDRLYKLESLCFSKAVLLKDGKVSFIKVESEEEKFIKKLISHLKDEMNQHLENGVFK